MNIGEQWVSNPSLGTSLLIACYGKSIFKNIYVATPTTNHSTNRHRANNKAPILSTTRTLASISEQASRTFLLFRYGTYPELINR